MGEGWVVVNDLAQYDKFKRWLQPGDGIAFWGKRRNPVSGLIQFFQRGGPSHWATVSQAIHANGPIDVEIFQSTLVLGKIDGCCRTPLADELAGCWCATAYPLAERYRKILDQEANLAAFYAAIGRWTDTVKYDLPGLFREFLPALLNQSACTDKMFCSAAGCRLLEEAGVIMPGLDYSGMTPNAMAKLGLWSTQLALVGHRGVVGFVPCQ